MLCILINVNKGFRDVEIRSATVFNLPLVWSVLTREGRREGRSDLWIVAGAEGARRGGEVWGLGSSWCWG